MKKKGDGLDFYFKEKDNNSPLCGNFGLNLNTNLDKTNLVLQLKKKNYINKYIWTLKYQTEEDGIIVIGTEPHFYQNDYYFPIKQVSTNFESLISYRVCPLNIVRLI